LIAGISNRPRVRPTTLFSANLKKRRPLARIKNFWYVASTFDIPSTSKIVLVKPTVPEPPPTCVDKGKTVVGGDVSKGHSKASYH